MLIQPNEGGAAGILLWESSEHSTARRIKFQIPGDEVIESRPFMLPCLCCVLPSDREETTEEQKAEKAALREQIMRAATEAGVSIIHVRHPENLGAEYEIPGIYFVDGDDKTLAKSFANTTLDVTPTEHR
jgi:hypothetical protein